MTKLIFVVSISSKRKQANEKIAGHSNALFLEEFGDVIKPWGPLGLPLKAK